MLMVLSRAQIYMEGFKNDSKNPLKHFFSNFFLKYMRHTKHNDDSIWGFFGPHLG